SAFEDNERSAPTGTDHSRAIVAKLRKICKIPALPLGRHRRTQMPKIHTARTNIHNDNIDTKRQYMHTVAHAIGMHNRTKPTTLNKPDRICTRTESRQSTPSFYFNKNDLI